MSPAVEAKSAGSLKVIPTVRDALEQSLPRVLRKVCLPVLTPSGAFRLILFAKDYDRRPSMRRNGGYIRDICQVLGGSPEPPHPRSGLHGYTLFRTSSQCARRYQAPPDQDAYSAFHGSLFTPSLPQRRRSHMHSFPSKRRLHSTSHCGTTEAEEVRRLVPWKCDCLEW